MKIQHKGMEFDTENDIEWINWLCPGEGCEVTLNGGNVVHLTGEAYDQIRSTIGLPPWKAPKTGRELYKEIMGEEWVD